MVEEPSWSAAMPAAEPCHRRPLRRRSHPHLVLRTQEVWLPISVPLALPPALPLVTVRVLRIASSPRPRLFHLLQIALTVMPTAIPRTLISLASMVFWRVTAQIVLWKQAKPVLLAWLRVTVEWQNLVAWFYCVKSVGMWHQDSTMEFMLVKAVRVSFGGAFSKTSSIRSAWRMRTVPSWGWTGTGASSAALRSVCLWGCHEMLFDLAEFLSVKNREC